MADARRIMTSELWETKVFSKLKLVSDFYCDHFLEKCLQRHLVAVLFWQKISFGPKNHPECQIHVQGARGNWLMVLFHSNQECPGNHADKATAILCASATFFPSTHTVHAK